MRKPITTGILKHFLAKIFFSLENHLIVRLIDDCVAGGKSLGVDGVVRFEPFVRKRRLMIEYQHW